MAVYSVTGPAQWDIMPAYNQIIITVYASTYNPVVYCDVYLGNTYYKSILAMTYTYAGGLYTYTFDIRDAVQEWLRASPPPYKHTPFIWPENSGLAYCYVRVRGSSIPGAFTVVDGPSPIQGTVDTAPVSGGGIASNTFLVLNAALQQEDLQPARAFLAQNLRPGPAETAPIFNWGGWATIYNLFQNPNLHLNKTDVLSLPVLFDHNTFGVTNTANIGIVILREDSQEYYLSATGSTLQQVFADTVYYVPAGPGNFDAVPSTGGPTGLRPNWSTLQWYRVGIIDQLDPGGIVVWVSPRIYLDKPCPDRKRFRFVNYLGHYDTINFEHHEEAFVTASKTWEKFNPGSFSGVGKEQFGVQRFNVRAADKLQVTGYFSEAEMPFVKQFLATPTAYLETEGTAGQPKYRTAVVVMDGEFVTRKIEDRFYYEVSVTIAMSNERTTIRN